MSFLIEISVSLIIVSSILYLSYMVIPNNERVRSFFINNKKFLSPNCISNWRRFGGIPTVFVYVFGVYTDNYTLTYFAIWLFVFLTITDLLDGVVARQCNQKSSDGAILDAEADKWLDLPALIVLSVFPIVNITYLIIVLLILLFDLVGQLIRGISSPPEAGIFGKAKTTVKFAVIYLMTLSVRYPDLHSTLKLEIVIVVLLLTALILAGISMGMKTKWYKQYARRYLQEYLLKTD